jgi:hypothetical protein
MLSLYILSDYGMCDVDFESDLVKVFEMGSIVPSLWVQSRFLVL